MESAVESRACLCFSIAGARVRLINVAIAGLGKACKSLCCAMNCTLNFES
ncbi:hypothetical protein T11_13867 [Trichinella zimbabwensis]|uniref:Uncharacterized protein n=1 Tax=Trichinella zimbabwensis TaxID=268475 RepID=A0A0V1GF47_9BILA|nr:hypothetical protein T11_10751 [Trichinella zimbabwensis]KRY96831.1 hypothetical protein T11_13867 [Trichinella zimbabwensis]